MKERGISSAELQKMTKLNSSEGGESETKKFLKKWGWRIGLVGVAFFALGALL